MAQISVTCRLHATHSLPDPQEIRTGRGSLLWLHQHRGLVLLRHLPGGRWDWGTHARTIPERKGIMGVSQSSDPPPMSLIFWIECTQHYSWWSAVSDCTCCTCLSLQCPSHAIERSMKKYVWAGLTALLLFCCSSRRQTPLQSRWLLSKHRRRRPCKKECHGIGPLSRFEDGSANSPSK